MKLKHGEKSIDNTRERTVHGKVKGKAVQGASSARWLNRLDEKDLDQRDKEELVQ